MDWIYGQIVGFLGNFFALMGNMGVELFISIHARLSGSDRGGAGISIHAPREGRDPPAPELVLCGRRRLTVPILNYTTKVDVFTTLGEIQAMLVKHGARKIMQDYDDSGHITSLSFLIDTPDGPRGIRLPANVDAVLAVLVKQKVKCGRDQAERVAWRILKDWVAAQMAILESEMVQMDEVFLPYMVNDSGQTLFQCYRNKQLAIGGTR